MAEFEQKKIGLGLLGLGTVGSGVVKILQSEGRAIEEKTGLKIAVRKICVRSLSKKRAASVSRSILTTRAKDVIQDPSVDIVVELMGGIHPAKDLLLQAMENGKQVVTANKALLAEQGEEIYRQASRHSRLLGIEASVCGGIPIVQALRDGLASNNISQFLGIVNGTCNYILSAMSQRGIDFENALTEAQAKGYAESNPALDIDGVDSAHKLAVLARLAFRSHVPFDSISVEGIRHLSAVDLGYAAELGYVVKLLAIGKKMKNGLELRVHPTLLPFDHPLAAVRDVYNAVFLHADQAGDQLFYGRGAGSLPTASAVMSDVIDISKKIATHAAYRSVEAKPFKHLPMLPIDHSISKYYLRFQVADKPGVLGRIAQILGNHEISILSVHQKESHSTRSVPVVILTYEASEKNIQKALQAIDARSDIREKTRVIRVES